MGHIVSGTLYANVINFLGENVSTISKNSVAIFVASEEVGLDAGAGKIKRVFISRYQNEGQ
jgi:hypothetical protein